MKGWKRGVPRLSTRGSQNPHWTEIDEQELRQHYITEKLSIAKTAEVLGVDRKTVRSRLKRFGIPKRSYQEQYSIESNEGRLVEAHKHQRIEGSGKRNRKQYLALAKTLFDWKCQECGATETNEHFDLVVHHKDGNNHNNATENIIVLCQKCHARLHLGKTPMKQRLSKE
jgi:IS30 family transposase